MRELVLSGVGSRALDLVTVIVQADLIATSESSNFPGWFPNTTSHIKYSHSFLDTHLIREVVFVASESKRKRTFRSNTTQVERLRPSFLVEIGHKVVVAARY